MIKRANIWNESEGLQSVLVEIDIEIMGHPCFVHRDVFGDCRVTECRSGFALGATGDTVQDAIDKAREQVETTGIDRFVSAIEKTVAKYGEANP